MLAACEDRNSGVVVFVCPHHLELGRDGDFAKGTEERGANPLNGGPLRVVHYGTSTPPTTRYFVVAALKVIVTSGVTTGGGSIGGSTGGTTTPGPYGKTKIGGFSPAPPSAFPPHHM